MKVPAIKREECVCAGESGAKDGLVFGHVEDERPVEGEFIIFHDDLRAQCEPGASELGRLADKVITTSRSTHGDTIKVQPCITTRSKI